MINNFEIIKSLLQFDSEDDFYFSQIIKRKKEHKELGSNSYIVKTYYIKSLKDLDFYKDEMLCLANFHNARVCINLNRCSFEKIAFHNLIKVSNCIMNKDYKSVRKSYNSVCGAYNNEPEKKWIIDIDHKDIKKICSIMDSIDNIEPVKNRYIALLETKNGYHIICKPFNTMFFRENLLLSYDIHKQNPTILYVN